jgi:hypothetical protein
MPAKKKRAPILIIVLLCLTMPLLIAASAFYWVGTYYRDDDKIYPNISIAGVDVSWLTRDEALQSLNLSEYELRGNNAEITLIFPDGSELTVRGEDVLLQHDALHVVENAFFVGRGRGFIPDTIFFLQRINGEGVFFDINYELDLDALHAYIETFTDGYNSRLDASKPLIYNDRIVMTKGAGQVYADKFELYDIVYIALLDSLYDGNPVEIVYALPESITDTGALLEIHSSIHVPVRSAELDRETWEVSDCVVGVDFCVSSAISLLDATESGKTATISVEYLQPEVTRDYLESKLYRDLIGECTTWVHGGADRITNVRLSSEAINGLLLEPGEEFSFNGTVGVRSFSRGYRPAGAFINNEQVTVIGGGICQVSSTIYSAIRDTGLLITERHQHSRAVPYLPRGRDATVFWRSLDFRFANNTEYPLRIDIELVDRDLTARVYGTIIDDFPAKAS